MHALTVDLHSNRNASRDYSKSRFDLDELGLGMNRAARIQTCVQQSYESRQTVLQK